MSRRTPSGSTAVLHVVNHRIRISRVLVVRSVASHFALSHAPPLHPSPSGRPPRTPRRHLHPPPILTRLSGSTASITNSPCIVSVLRSGCIILSSHVSPCMRICLLSVCSQFRRSHPSCSPSAYRGVIILYRGLTAILPIPHRSPPCPTLYRAGRHIDVER